ncbi:juvenile hormone epoxide hydrolase 1-like [Haematobia irritans]|uniref:juvenile hormone epoxide hydrolase 1-like n=1 Tax=Haematobia irritans TaxID=7368 RepID=UPI003F4FD1B5
MRFMKITIIVALGLVLACLVQKYRQLQYPLPPPDIDLNKYWGPGSGVGYKENVTITAFDISAQPEIIEDLKLQLNRPIHLHEPLEGVAFEYGFNSIYLQKIVKYWRDDYLPKWEERENHLKKFDHFQTEIQGIRNSFIHENPKNVKNKKVLPLLILHGWPGSVREFYDIIPMLTTPSEDNDYVFEVIAPSLPGYGWSQAASKKHMDNSQIAVILRHLMVRLGHEKFIIHGGDWGSIIGSNLAALFPQNTLAYHSNLCVNFSPLGVINGVISRLVPNFFYEKKHSKFFKTVREYVAFVLEEFGYFHLQATKPDTIGTVLSHNPIGLAAYILEKFSSVTNSEFKHLNDGGLTKHYTLDSLLDNIMIYYITNSITTSQRLYAENVSKSYLGKELERVTVKAPAGCAHFLHDIDHHTDYQLRSKFINLIHTAYYEDGGHFIAMEMPRILYEDFIEFIKKANL